jgi:hypothetical protein
MSQYLNGNAKTPFFPEAGGQFNRKYINDHDWLIPQTSSDWTWSSVGANSGRFSALDSMYEMIGYFETNLYGCLEMQTDNMQALIDKTNNRIYGEL